MQRLGEGFLREKVEGMAVKVARDRGNEKELV